MSLEKGALNISCGGQDEDITHNHQSVLNLRHSCSLELVLSIKLESVHDVGVKTRPATMPEIDFITLRTKQM